MVYSRADIGLPVTDSLPPGTRVLAGLFQGLAARASGFAIVSLSALAPAVMYVGTLQPCLLLLTAGAASYSMCVSTLSHEVLSDASIVMM